MQTNALHELHLYYYLYFWEQKAPHYILEKLPPKREDVETIKILRQTNKTTAALKGIAKTL